MELEKILHTVILQYLAATMVPHNICILQGDLVDFEHGPDEAIRCGQLCADRRTEGVQKRCRIINALPMRNNYRLTNVPNFVMYLCDIIFIIQCPIVW